MPVPAVQRFKLGQRVCRPRGNRGTVITGVIAKIGKQNDDEPFQYFVLWDGDLHPRARAYGWWQLWPEHKPPRHGARHSLAGF